ncbi:MAG: nuclear transport factor 2 family protein [Gemmatimonadota bacterium]|nr:nuclear transport factor 2 family protein [Gemmatimonadota bacterium]
MRILNRLTLPIAAVIALVVSTSAAFAQARGDDQQKFTTRETALWASVKAKEMTALKGTFSDDYAATYSDGIVGRDDELTGIGKSQIASARIDDVKVHRLDAATVVVTSKATVDGTTDGKSISGTYNTMTVWHRVSNLWKVAAHTEVKTP